MNGSVLGRQSSKYVISKSNMIELGVRPQLGSYLKHIWGLRRYILGQGRYQAFSAGNGTALGKVWLLLDPFVLISFYYVVFGLIIKTDRGIDNFIAFLAIGIIMFRPLQSSISRGPAVLQQNNALLKSFNFPKPAVFLSYGVRSSLESIPDLIALLLFIMLIPPHITPSWSWLVILVALACRQFMIVGISLITARLTHFVPDLVHVWPILARFWFYTSGVLFSIDHYVRNQTALAILELNPGAALLSFSRVVLMENSFPHLSDVLQLAGWAVLLFMIGFLACWQGEVKLNRDRWI